MKKGTSLITKLPEAQTALHKAVPKANVKQKVLLRSFIHDRLYGAADPSLDLSGGYFTRKEHQVGKLKAPIEFP